MDILVGILFIVTLIVLIWTIIEVTVESSR